MVVGLPAKMSKATGNTNSNEQASTGMRQSVIDRRALSITVVSVDQRSIRSAATASLSLRFLATQLYTAV